MIYLIWLFSLHIAYLSSLLTINFSHQPPIARLFDHIISVRGGQGLSQEHRKNDITIGDKTDNKTTGDERMLATAPGQFPRYYQISLSNHFFHLII